MEVDTVGVVVDFVSELHVGAGVSVGLGPGGVVSSEAVTEEFSCVN